MDVLCHSHRTSYITSTPSVFEVILQLMCYINYLLTYVMVWWHNRLLQQQLNYLFVYICVFNILLIDYCLFDSLLFLCYE